MPVMKNVLGIDLGTHSLKAVEFRQTLRGLDAVALHSLPRADGEIPLSDLVRRFLELHKLSTEHVVAALPGDRFSSRRLSFPFRERRKIAQAIPFAVEEEMPFELEDVVIDWEQMSGDRTHTEVLATVAPRSEVSERLSVLDSAGCAPRTLEAEGLVLANLCAVFDLPGVHLLADVGHRKTTLCLLADGRAVAARSLPLGGLHITQALAADRGLPLEEAERAKCEEGIFGGGGAPPQTAQILDRLARESVRTLGAAEGILGGATLERTTLFGGSAALAGLDSYLAERTGVHTERLGLPREEHAGLAAGGPPILFAPAIALALRGTAQARTRMNFRQDEFAVRLDLDRFRRDFRWTGWLSAAALLLAVLSFGTGAALEAQRAATLERQAKGIYSEIFPGETPPENTVSALGAQVRQANERAEFLGVYRGNLSALDLLTEISNRVPPNLDIGLEELSIDRQSIRMRVQAKSFKAADRLGLELAKFLPFQAAKIGAIETDSKTGGKRFSVTISLQPPEDRG